MAPFARAAFASLLVLAGCHNAPLGGVALAPEPQAVDLHALRRDTVHATLARHRAEQIARLDAYAAAGQFPHNFTTAPSLHMFRDGGGRLCAVANLVHRDGRDDLVDATVRTRNDLAIADVHDGPMLDWVLASGLTQEELVDIQLPAPVMLRPVSKPVQIAKVDPAPISEKQMDAIVRAHVADVGARLRAASEASLDLAVARYIDVYTPS